MSYCPTWNLMGITNTWVILISAQKLRSYRSSSGLLSVIFEFSNFLKVKSELCSPQSLHQFKPTYSFNLFKHWLLLGYDSRSSFPIWLFVHWSVPAQRWHPRWFYSWSYLFFLNVFELKCKYALISIYSFLRPPTAFTPLLYYVSYLREMVLLLPPKKMFFVHILLNWKYIGSQD